MRSSSSHSEAAVGWPTAPCRAVTPCRVDTAGVHQCDRARDTPAVSVCTHARWIVWEHENIMKSKQQTSMDFVNTEYSYFLYLCDFLTFKTNLSPLYLEIPKISILNKTEVTKLKMLRKLYYPVKSLIIFSRKTMLLSVWINWLWSILSWKRSQTQESK